MAVKKDRSTELLLKFRQLFVGASDRFTMHVPPFTPDDTKDGKIVPAFCGFAKYGKPQFKTIPNGYEDGDYVPVTPDLYKAHLNGELGLALSPLIPNVRDKKNVCAYGVLDFDKRGVDYLELINRLYADGFKFSAFQSKSTGIHLYFRFQEYTPAVQVQDALWNIVQIYGLENLYGKGKIEVFPEHTERKPGVKDKGILLPWFNCVSDDCFNMLLAADGELVNIDKGIDIFEAQSTTIKELNETISRLPYSDAPYCVQSLLLNGQLRAGDHRNDFIFTTALYLKQKYGKESFTVEMLEEANDRLAEPLSARDIQATYTSAQSGDFPLPGQCKKEPMCSFCDRKLCKERDFAGVKKDKGNVASNIEFGQMWRVLTEQPYYLLEARVAGTENEFKTLQIDSAQDLMNQAVVSCECINKLNQAMWEVKKIYWTQRLNEILERVQNKEVPKATDTSELNDLQSLFVRYLTHRQVQSTNPFHVTLRQVFYKDGKFYFQTDGFKEYLRLMKYTLGRTNLRERLLSYGCSEGVVQYKRKNKTKGEIKCWVKEEDEILKNMTVYFEDMIEQDEQILEEETLNKTETKHNSSDVDDRRF